MDDLLALLATNEFGVESNESLNVPIHPVAQLESFNLIHTSPPRDRFSAEQTRHSIQDSNSSILKQSKKSDLNTDRNAFNLMEGKRINSDHTFIRYLADSTDYPTHDMFDRNKFEFKNSSFMERDSELIKSIDEKYLPADAHSKQQLSELTLLPYGTAGTQ